MLQITIEPIELFDETKSLFITSKRYELSLEHSLISLSRWESKWHKAFLTKIPKTDEETLDYIRCMTLTRDIDDDVYKLIDKPIMDKINQYIEDPMTATTFPKEANSRPSREIMTSELIYFWMINYSIPSEYQKWHLNRLLTLINVCAIKNKKPTKTPQKDLLNRNRILNEQRLKAYNTSG